MLRSVKIGTVKGHDVGVACSEIESKNTLESFEMHSTVFRFPEGEGDHKAVSP